MPPSRNPGREWGRLSLGRRKGFEKKQHNLQRILHGHTLKDISHSCPALLKAEREIQEEMTVQLL